MTAKLIRNQIDLKVSRAMGNSVPAKFPYCCEPWFRSKYNTKGLILHFVNKLFVKPIKRTKQNNLYEIRKFV